MQTTLEFADMQKEIFGLLNRYSSLPTKSNSNIFEILNIGYSEETISDFLKYYFNSKNGHNLEKIFLKALQECDENLKINSDEKILDVRREEANIDIIIECEKSVIVIENKIYHHAKDNPFEKYQEHIEKEYPSKTSFFFILSLVEVPQKLYAKTKFKKILYREFIESLSKNISQSVFEIPILHLNLLKDFIWNMKYLLREDNDNPRAEFFFRNYEIFQKISESIKENKAMLDFYSKILDELKSFFDLFQENEISLFYDRKVLSIAKQLNQFEGFGIGKHNKWFYNVSKNTNRGWRFIQNSNFPDLIFFDLNFENLIKNNEYSIQISTTQNYKQITDYSISLEEYIISKTTIIDKINEKKIMYDGTKKHVIFRKPYSITFSEINNIEDNIIKNLNSDWKDLLNDLFKIMEFVQIKYQENE